MQSNEKDNDFSFMHLNIQTNSNLSFSFINISQLVNFAKEKKRKFLSISDFYPFEIINFLRLCKEKKIKPIWGNKIFIIHEQRKFLATIFPKNNVGCKDLISKLFSINSPWDEHIFHWKYIVEKINKKNFFIILEANKMEDINYFVNFLIKETLDILIGIKFFLLNPSEFLSSKIISSLLIPFFSIKVLFENEIELLNLWKKTNLIKKFIPEDIQESNFFSYDSEKVIISLTNDTIVQKLLVLNLQKFISKININEKFLKTKKIEKKKEDDSLSKLKTKCWEKILIIEKKSKNIYKEALEKELKVIEKFNYQDFFLLFSEIVEYLKKKDIIIGPGRGSVVSSLVAYLLGITSIDPLKHNLFFERFLNEKREKMPDIDLDIERQDEIFNYLLEKYTASHISRIFIRKKIGWKTSLNQSLKIFRIKDIEKEEILKFSENILETNSLKLQHLKIKYPVFFSLVDKISDLYFDISIHPSSIIISNYSLVGMVPIRKKENFPFSFFSGEELEKLGLRRYDFLSLKESLGFISDVKNLKFLSNLKFDLKINLPTFQEVDLFDKKTWNLLMNFCLSGIFQLDTKFTRSLFIRFCPKNFTELIIFLSINRPGSRKKLEDIIKRKNNNTKESSFSSNKIREILLETYDFIIFEEQISQIFCLIFDCSFAEAELKRIRLKEKGLEEDFFKKAYEKLSNSDIKLITKQLLFSREYSFNKSHAVAYSYLTYYIAFLKANFFSELIIFFLNEKKEKKINYIQEAIFFDFIIKKPDINYSEINWIKEKKTLIMGFSDLNKNNNTFFSSIIVERKEKGLYDNWENFLSRTYKFWENIKIEHFNNWIDSEIFLSLKVDSSVIKENIDSIFRYIDIRKKLGNVDNKLLPFSFFPLSKEKKEENNREINEKEQKNLNCYISFFSRWNDFKRKGEINSLFDIFQKENNCEVIVKIYAVIYHIEKEKKKWILSFRDIRSFFKIEVDDIFFENNKVNLMKHNEMILNCSVKITNKKINHILLRKIN